MPNLPVPSNGFSSTPVKCNYGSHSPTSDDMDHGVLSDDEDTFSLLSPVYHDSFDSDEEDPGETPRPSLPYSGLSISPIRYPSSCDLSESHRHSTRMYYPQSLSPLDVSPQSPPQSRGWMFHLDSVPGKCGW